MSPTVSHSKSTRKSGEPQADHAQSPSNAWGDRVRALKNVPAVLHFVWESGPRVVFWNIALRVLVAFLPVGIGIVGRFIIDGVNNIRLHRPLPQHFWWLVGTEMTLAMLIGILSRAVDYFDNLLADRYTHHVSVEVMSKAASLDVTAYEDPVFYDRLERARVQATDRLAMIQQMGRLIQQTVTAVAFSAVLIRYSPLLLLLLIAGIIPAFLGESHFAFLTYAKNFHQTPWRRQMDYLRQVGGSKEAAKELKLFNLSNYLTDRFTGLSQKICEENIALNRRRLFWGGLLAILGQLGYYGAYAYSIFRTIQGRYSVGDLTLITTAIMQSMANIQQAFSTASGVADQALFLTDLIAFFEMKPRVESKAGGIPAPHPVTRGFEFRNVSFVYPGTNRRILSDFNFTLCPGERVALIGENGQGKTTLVKLITRLYDPTEGQILLDGIDLREYDLAALHSEIGVKSSTRKKRLNTRQTRAWPPALLPHCREDTTRCLAAGLTAAWTCLAGNGRSWLWHERISATRSCSFSTNRPPHSMLVVSSKSFSALPNSPSARWPWLFPIAFRPSVWQTALLCLKPAALWKKAATPNSLRSAADMPPCLRCKLQVIDETR
jgi:ATP-binding cassette subfamily B protein